MRKFIKIPSTIIIGYKRRKRTICGFLSTLTYSFADGVIYNRNSFRKQIDVRIPHITIINNPISGYTLNSKSKSTDIWVCDPRGFEFEISPENLLYILRHMSYSIVDGFDGHLILSWHQNEFILLPTNSELFISTKLKELK